MFSILNFWIFYYWLLSSLETLILWYRRFWPEKTFFLIPWYRGPRFWKKNFLFFDTVIPSQILKKKLSFFLIPWYRAKFWIVFDSGMPEAFWLREQFQHVCFWIFFCVDVFGAFGVRKCEGTNAEHSKSFSFRFCAQVRICWGYIRFPHTILFGEHIDPPRSSSHRCLKPWPKELV